MIQQRVTPTIFLRIYALLLLVVVAMLGYNEWTTRSDALTQATEKSRALVNLATEHTLRMFEINDIALRSAVEHFSELDITGIGHSWANWDYLATLEASSIGSELAQIRHMLIIDPAGVVRIHSRRFPLEPIDNSRNDFFQAHKDTSGPSLFVGTPAVDVAGEEIFFSMSRRISRPRDGAFAGVAAAAVKPDISQRFFDSMAAGPNGILFLMHENGTIITSHPFQKT